jgi:hypothetical protein
MFMSEDDYESEFLDYYFEHGFVNTCKRGYEKVCEKIDNILSSEIVQTACMRTLWTVSKIMVYTECAIVYVCNSNEFTKHYTDKLVSMKNTFYSTNTISDPSLENNKWIQVCRIFNSDDVYKLLYVNSTFSNNVSNKYIKLEYSKIYNSIMNLSNNDTCIITKYDNLYNVSNSNINIDDEVALIQSTNIPLSITYKHPMMNDDIDISIPEEMYCIGNCLFSNAFILRCLESQSQPFIFSKDYELTIIDSFVTIHSLTYNNYVKISQAGFDLCDLVENDKWFFNK